MNRYEEYKQTGFEWIGKIPSDWRLSRVGKFFNERLEKVDDIEIKKYMTGENTDENKQNYFRKQFEGLMVDYVNERFEFFKKMEDHPSVKTMIFQKIYSDYQKSQSSPEGK